MQSSITPCLDKDQDGTNRQVAVKCSLEPLASRAQDVLVDFPSVITADNGGICKESSVEKPNVGIGKAAAVIAWRHLDVQIW